MHDLIHDISFYVEVPTNQELLSKSRQELPYTIADYPYPVLYKRFDCFECNLICQYNAPQNSCSIALPVVPIVFFNWIPNYAELSLTLCWTLALCTLCKYSQEVYLGIPRSGLAFSRHTEYFILYFISHFVIL